MDFGMFFSVCFPLLLISVFSLLLSTAVNIGFGRAIPIPVLSVIVFLYPFYAADSLRIGRILLAIVLCVLCIGLTVYCLRVKELSDRFKKHVVSTSFLLYCAFVCLLLLLSANKFVCFWDSLRLWGAYPKALWSYEARQLGADAIVYPIMQSYAPGMPLLCYFMESFSGSFHEGSLYFTYGFFDVILILPVIELVTGKIRRAADKGYLFFAKALFFSIVAAIVFPWLIYKNCGPYVTLYIDPPLGILAGYYFAVCFEGFGSGKIPFVSALLSGVCLVLFKDSGILFAVAGVIGAVVCCEKKTLKKSLIGSVGVLTAVLVVWYSWRSLLNVYSVSNHLSHELSIPGWSVIMRFVVNVLQLDAVELDLVAARISISFPAALLILLGLKLIPAYFSLNSFKRELLESAVMLVTAIVFLVGYYFVFQSSINEENYYPSYSRYLGSIILCVIYVLAHDFALIHLGLIDRQKNKLLGRIVTSQKKQTFFNAVKYFLLSLTVLITVGSLLYIFRGKAKITDPDFAEASEIASSLLHSVETGDKLTDVYLCIPGDSKGNERLHHRTYFELIDKHIRIKNFYLTTDITSSGSGYSSGQFIDILIADHCDYVMFSGISEDIYHEFSDILGDVSVGESNVIYRVNAKSRSIDRFNKQ